MTAETTSTLKKMLATVALFFSLFLVLMALQYVTGGAAEAGIRKSAETALRQWNEKAPAVTERLPALRAGWAYTHVYRTAGKGKNAGLVFVIPITGNSGPYTGVFYWTEQSGAVFCGLAGPFVPPARAGSYGITGRVLAYWLGKIEILAVTNGAVK